VTNETRYQENPRRFCFHLGLGAAVAAVGFLTGPRGLFWAFPVVGGLLVFGGGWGLSNYILGRSDYLVLSDEELSYVHPVHADRNKSVPLEDVAQVSLGSESVRKVKEVRVTVAMKGGGQWTFGERFMSTRQLTAFVQDLQGRLSRLH
jgi:hypothetical protein